MIQGHTCGGDALDREPTKAEIGAYKRALVADVCSYCGGPAEMLEHIDAKSRGGGNEWDNLTGACHSCNWKKKSQSLLGFLGSRQFRPTYVDAIETFGRWVAV